MANLQIRTLNPDTRRRRRITLREEVYSHPRIDRQDHLIRGVWILGFISKNGRRYDREAIRKAAPLYEGRPVYISVGRGGALDHARRTGRTFGKRVGVLQGVYLARDGLRGNIRYFVDHPDSEQLLRYAESAPRGVGLSHDAVGESQGNTVTVIHSVTAVELVDNPATTRGLFESQARRPGQNEHEWRWQAAVARAQARLA